MRGFLFFIWNCQIFCYITQYDQQNSGVRDCSEK